MFCVPLWVSSCGSCSSSAYMAAMPRPSVARVLFPEAQAQGQAPGPRPFARVAPQEAKTAPMQEVKLKVCNTPAISMFDDDTTHAPGFLSHQEISMKHALASATTCKFALEKETGLSKPAICNNWCVIGTDDPMANDLKKHCLMSIDLSQPAITAHSIKSVWPMAEPVRDVHFGASDMLIVTTGDGKLYVFRLDVDGKLEEKVCWGQYHSNSVREIAINKHCPGQFVSGGFDKRLCLFDINKPERLTASKLLPDTIGSVRWPVCNQNVCVSCTTDDGRYMIYDIRQGLTAAAFEATMGKVHLYTHERYSDHYVILGFGDGEIQHIDMRVTEKILHRVQDPYVEGVGHIEYNHDSGAFAVSGFNGFTVWKQDSVSQVAHVWSSSHVAGLGTNTSCGYSMIATFVNRDTILASSSIATIATYTQKWDTFM